MRDRGTAKILPWRFIAGSCFLICPGIPDPNKLLLPRLAMLFPAVLVSAVTVIKSLNKNLLRGCSVFLQLQVAAHY